MGVSKVVEADIDTIPVFQRGGSVIPRKLRLRRSSLMMKSDPYTLYVALDRFSKAQGHLYMDDEETFSYSSEKKFALARFNVDLDGASATMSNTVELGRGWESSVGEQSKSRMVERVVIAGVGKKPNAITLKGEDLSFKYDAKTKILVV